MAGKHVQGSWCVRGDQLAGENGAQRVGTG